MNRVILILNYQIYIRYLYKTVPRDNAENVVDYENVNDDVERDVEVRRQPLRRAKLVLPHTNVPNYDKNLSGSTPMKRKQSTHESDEKDSTMNQTVYQTNKTINKQTNKTIDEPMDQTLDQSTNQTINRPTNQTIDQPMDQTVDNLPSHRYNLRSLDKRKYEESDNDEDEGHVEKWLKVDALKQASIGDKIINWCEAGRS